MMARSVRRGQFIVVGAILLLLILLAILGIELLLSPRGPSNPIQGEPKKDPATGLYTVYLLVSGHRDLTVLHWSLHANVRVDFVSFYFESSPEPASGSSLLDFSKSVHVIVTVKGGGLGSTLLSTFDMSVSLGARWGRVLVYTLPPGTYTVEVQGIDQDGFLSSTTSQLILP